MPTQSLNWQIGEAPGYEVLDARADKLTSDRISGGGVVPPSNQDTTTDAASDPRASMSQLTDDKVG